MLCPVALPWRKMSIIYVDVDRFVGFFPELRHLNQSQQSELANVACSIAMGFGNRHKDDPSGYSIPYKFYNPKICSQNSGDFVRLVRDCEMFEVSDNWYPDKHLSRVYWPTEKLRQIAIQCIVEQATTPEGKKIRMQKQAISSRDINDNPRKTKGNIPAFVSVQTEGLEELQDLLRTNPNRIERIDGRIGGHQLRTIDRMQGNTDAFLFAANTSSRPGEIYQKYHETNARICGDGRHLQTAMREVRWAALDGCHKYDMENCHYRFLYQLACYYGYSPQVIKYYLDDKDKFRRDKARFHGVDEEIIKEVLIELAYGAELSDHPRTAIGKIIMLNGCESLITDPELKQIKQEATGAGRIILQNAPTHKNNIINALGKGVSVTLTEPQKIAHLLQGMETYVLDGVIQHYPDNVIVLVHDCWITRSKIDKSELEKTPFASHNDQALQNITIKIAYEQIKAAA